MQYPDGLSPHAIWQVDLTPQHFVDYHPLPSRPVVTVLPFTEQPVNVLPLWTTKRVPVGGVARSTVPSTFIPFTSPELPLCSPS